MSENNLILDTTYVLPLFGVDIDLTPNFKNELKNLWKHGIPGLKIFLPSVCLIETMYKLNREYRNKKDITILRRYPQILPTIITSKIVDIKHPQFNPTASKIAITLRQENLTDLMDCWIAASAVDLKGILLTEDKELKEILKKIPETKTIITWSWKDLQNNIKLNKKRK